MAVILCLEKWPAILTGGSHVLEIWMAFHLSVRYYKFPQTFAGDLHMSTCTREFSQTYAGDLHMSTCTREFPQTYAGDLHTL